jgi:hypothetical protein
MPDGESATDVQGRALAFGKPLLHSLCNHFADAIANGGIIEH